jgi:feruloyl esterase
MTVASKAINPDLRTFRSLGHKLLQFHGWADQSVSPHSSIEYKDSVDAVLGSYADRSQRAQQDSGDFYRLFRVPGMYNCAAGPGTDFFDGLGALRAWVEEGTAPDRITAAHLTSGRVDKTRPLCPYPQEARYVGSGGGNDANNFSCAVSDSNTRPGFSPKLPLSSQER